MVSDIHFLFQSIELAEHMRGPYMRVGYPGGKPSHHLPHAVSNQVCILLNF